MQTISAGITDIGRKRSQNEDNFLINDRLNLFIVADGMGGHAGGDVASAMAVLAIEEAYENSVTDNALGALHGPQERLRDAIVMAGTQVYNHSQTEECFRGMGTTVVAVAVSDKIATVAHVGDSRCYHWRGDKLTQVTSDHSLVNEKIEAGLLSLEDAKTHRLKNVITRSLGFDRTVAVDVQSLEMKNADQLLLCSDGLSGLVSAKEMAEHLSSHSPQSAARALVELALIRGGEDNITVIITQFVDM